MPTFTIDDENRIRALGPDEAKEITDMLRFNSEREFAELAKQWPATRLVEIWDGITGVTPVRKFMSRSIAVERIWQAIRNLTPAGAEPKPKETPRKAQAAKEAAGGERSKKDTLIALLSNGAEATIDQLVTASGWQKHSIRGFLSGTLKKQMGLEVISARNSEASASTV